MPGASRRPPTSPSTSTRRPCRPSRRSFPSCPSVVPAPPGTGGKLRPPAPRLLDAHWGTGSVGRAAGAPPVVGGGAEAEEPVLLAGSTGSCSTGSAPRQGNGRRANARRGGRRLEAGAGGKDGGGAGGRTADGWKVRLEGGLTGRSVPAAPGLRPGAPTPFPPGLRATGGQRSVRGLPDSRKDLSRSGRVGAHGELGPSGGGGCSPSDLVRAPEFRTVGSNCSLLPPRVSPREKVDGCVGAPQRNEPHLRPRAREGSLVEGVGGSGETARSPFPKCFLAPTKLRRACGALRGARGQVASAPCCRPRVASPRPALRPASSQCSGGTEVPKAGGASEYSKI